jgi:hypothetical protein
MSRARDLVKYVFLVQGACMLLEGDSQSFTGFLLAALD